MKPRDIPDIEQMVKPGRIVTAIEHEGAMWVRADTYQQAINALAESWRKIAELDRLVHPRAASITNEQADAVNAHEAGIEYFTRLNDLPPEAWNDPVAWDATQRKTQYPGSEWSISMEVPYDPAGTAKAAPVSQDAEQRPGQ